MAPVDDTSYTTRINFDHSITPTLLLHIGAGFLYYNHPVFTPTSNFTANVNAVPGVNGGFAPFPASQYMPSFAALANTINFTGGLALGSGFGGPAPGTPAFRQCRAEGYQAHRECQLDLGEGESHLTRRAEQ